MSTAASEKNVLIIECKEGGELGYLLQLFPKFYNNVFLFVGLSTLGTFIEF